MVEIIKKNANQRYVKFKENANQNYVKFKAKVCDKEKRIKQMKRSFYFGPMFFQVHAWIFA